MIRRRIATLLAFAALTTVACSHAPYAVSHYNFLHTDPNTTEFDHDWKFHLGDAQGAEQATFVDNSWRTLTLPHDFALEGPAIPQPGQEGPFDPKSAAGAGGGYLDASQAWYRKSFTLPASAKGHRVSVQFDGVYMDSDVYLNGKLLGNRPYGYSSFEYDLTPILNFDKPNTLAVHINVEQPSSRWYSGAGIYRHVRLHITDPVHIAQWGNYITTPQVTDASATLNVRTTVQNDSATPASVELTTRVLDPEGHQFEFLRIRGAIAPNASTDLNPVIIVPGPRLWSTDSPTLYTVVSELSMNGKVIDSSSTPIGIRTIQFTADNGFLLNGKRVQIQGVCDHHDLGSLGSAINYRALQRQLEILRSFGCNAIRTSHNPPDPELLDLADRMGFLVMDEAFDEWKRNKTKFGYGRFFDDWSERDIVSMIHRDRNHPSIILWSIGNEIPEQGSPNGGEMAKRLADICHREDPTRFVSSACNNPPGAVQNGYAAALDVFGINYRIPAYTTYKGRIIMGSETVSALSSRGEYGLSLDASGNVQIAKEIRATSQVNSYDIDAPRWGNTAEAQFIGLKNAPWVAGEFVWTGFDYIGEPTPYNWPSRSSYFGIVDIAGFPKDRYYIYQSQWTTKPMVHLLPSWNWPGFEGKPIPVQAYTNADAVELFLNGQSLGKKESKDMTGIHYEWKVPYAAGTLKAVATKNGAVVATDEVISAGAPAKIELTADRSKITADGQDLSFITVRILDKDGHICPNADNSVHFTLTGPATIAGLDNGDATNHEPFISDTHKAFHGLALVILKSEERTPGQATLTVTGKDLRPSAISITLSK